MDPVLLVRILEPALLVVSIVLLVWLSLPKANPLLVTFRPVWRTFTRKSYFLYILVAFSIVLTNGVLTGIDARFTRMMVGGGRDFTALIQAVEGNAIGVFQRWTPLPLTWYMTWVYVIVFPALVPWAMMVFDYLGEKQRNIALLAGYLMNYVIVLPFYVFFPVSECHVVAGTDGAPAARLLIDDVHPAIMTILRPMSGIDNCFPSFHTSLAVTMALAAWHTRRKAFATVLTVLAAANVFSTLYLGIHWFSDVAAGLLLGLLAYLVARRVARRWNPV